MLEIVRLKAKGLAVSCIFVVCLVLNLQPVFLNSKHAMKQAGFGRASPYCHGADLVKAGGSYPVDSENSSH